MACLCNDARVVAVADSVSAVVVEDRGLDCELGRKVSLRWVFSDGARAVADSVEDFRGHLQRMLESAQSWRPAAYASVPARDVSHGRVLDMKTNHRRMPCDHPSCCSCAIL